MHNYAISTKRYLFHNILHNDSYAFRDKQEAVKVESSVLWYITTVFTVNKLNCFISAREKYQLFCTMLLCSCLLLIFTSSSKKKYIWPVLFPSPRYNFNHFTSGVIVCLKFSFYKCTNIIYKIRFRIIFHIVITALVHPRLTHFSFSLFLSIQ